MKHIKGIAVLAFALALAFALTACGGNANSSASSSTASESASASSAAQPAELVGKPWVTSVLSGNLPAQAPEAKDDLYTHYNYEYLAAHQGEDASTLVECAGELQTSVVAIIKDESKTGHDLDQLRIFYNQAADAEALKAVGFPTFSPISTASNRSLLSAR